MTSRSSTATAAKKGDDNIGFNEHKKIKGDKVVTGPIADERRYWLVLCQDALLLLAKLIIGGRLESVGAGPCPAPSAAFSPLLTVPHLQRVGLNTDPHYKYRLQSVLTFEHPRSTQDRSHTPLPSQSQPDRNVTSSGIGR